MFGMSFHTGHFLFITYCVTISVYAPLAVGGFLWYNIWSDYYFKIGLI